MKREYYLDLAMAGLRMPIGADLLLQAHSDAEAILLDGERLGHVLDETARRFATPLAVPHMNLELEKLQIMQILGVPAAQQAAFHFHAEPEEAERARISSALTRPLPPAMQAQLDAISYIARHTDHLPIGMTIGPFSLMTKLVADPITPVCLAGSGATAADDEDIRLVESVLVLGTRLIQQNIVRQIAAGARAIFIAEPAANMVYFSPNQLAAGADIFTRYVIAFHQQIKALLDVHGVDLIFHCCGELVDDMLIAFTQLDPAILSLGSSRQLWQDAALVPKSTVLYGNLPSKQFYADSLITVEEVIARGDELIARMHAAAHPFILGTECDVLSVPGCHETILRKADAVAHAAVCV